MLLGTGLLAIPLMVLGLLCGSSAWADPPPPSTVKCALNEYPETVNGTTTCKKVPSCTKDEVISYDTTTQKFACKKLVLCDPRHQQAAYINGKNVCIDVPNCDGKGQHYAFDGTKMVCQ